MRDRRQAASRICIDPALYQTIALRALAPRGAIEGRAIISSVIDISQEVGRCLRRTPRIERNDDIAR